MNSLFAEFREILRSGDEEKVRAFLRDHFTEFPEDMQKQIVMTTFEEGLAEKLAVEEAALAMKEDLQELLTEPTQEQ